MRKIIWIICAVLLLSACSSNGNYPDLPESTDITEVTAATDATDATDTTDATDAIDLSDLPDVMVYAIFYDTPYVGDILYKYCWRVSEEDRMDHPVLQSEVKKIPISYPITTSEQMEQYANALYKICVSQGLLDAELIAAGVDLYNDGVIVVEFCPSWEYDAWMNNALVYDGIGVFVLISAEDGHVIYFGVSEAWE